MIYRFRLLATALVLSLLAGFAVCGQQSKDAVDLMVKPARATDGFEQVAKAVSVVGKIVGRDDRSGRFRVRLLPGKGLQEAMSVLAGKKSLAVVEIAPPLPAFFGVDPNSVSSLKRRIAEIKRGWKAGGKPKTGALEAYLYYVQQRAYPYDRIDWPAMQRAAQHRDKMPAARIGGASTKSARSGAAFAQWEYIGPNNLDIPYRVYYGIRPLSGRINAIAYDPSTPDIIYLAGATGGLWKSNDHGATWACLSDAWEKMPVSSIAIDPSHPQTVYVGTGDYHGGSGYSIGIMKTTDGGTTWTNLGRSTFGDVAVSQVVVDPESTQNVVCVGGRGAANYGKVYRSTNGGTTWTTAVDVSASWCDVDFGIASGGKRVYYAVAGGSGGQIYRSADSGATWSAAARPSGATLNGTVDVAASRVNADTVYLLSTADQKIYKSTDRGDNWTDVTGSFPGGYNWSQGWYDYHITTGKRGANDLVFVGLIDIVYSPDGGATWTSMGGPTYSNSAITHNDQHSLAVNPTDSNEVLVGNDGGIFLYTYSGGNWTSSGLNRALGVTQFYKAAWHPTDPNNMVGGTQDNATPQTGGDIMNWNCVGGGDGGGCAINPANPLIQYCTVYNLNVDRTGDNWASSQSISPDIGSDNAPFVSQISIDPTNPRYLYGGTNYLYRWDDTAGTWTARLGGTNMSSGVVSTIAVAPSDGNIIYVGTSDGKVWRSGNWGAAWTQINGGLPNRYIGHISVSRTNPNDILVGLSGTGSSHVWRCTDASSTSRVWSAIDGSGVTGIPDIPVNAIARDYKDNDNSLFVATDVGVFMTTNGGLTWGNATNPLGLPNVQVNDLGVTPGNGYLFAATWGRGMWRMLLPTTPIGIQGFTLNPTGVVGGSASTGTVTLDVEAPPGGARVSLSSNNKAATVPPYATVAGGQTTGTFTVRTVATSVTTLATITAKIGSAGKTATLSVNPPGIQSLTLDPSTVPGGLGSTGTVVLSAPARAGGEVVSLAVDKSNVATVDWQLFIPEGATTGTFPISTVPVTATTQVIVRASNPGPTKYATLTVTPVLGLLKIAVSPTTIKGGGTAKGSVSLTMAAPANLVVTLTSSDPSVASVPATLTVKKGAKAGAFSVKTMRTGSKKSVTISASYGGTTLKVQLAVNP